MGNPYLDLNPTADHPTLHGGDLLAASRQYGIAPDQWLDLSTGISPFAYPFTPPPASAFQRLPYPDPKLQPIAQAYYQHPGLVTTAGSQPVIQALPSLLPNVPVWLPDIGYREHAQQWAAAGRLCRPYAAQNEEAMIAALDAALTSDQRSHLVIINPNNPSGTRLAPEQVRAWARRLAPGCYLILDEAFVDAEPDYSVPPEHWRENIIVLRSFGKFFGLAGLRLGFVACCDELRKPLHRALGLWSVNGPAQAIARQALNDRAWQRQARQRLQHANQLMRDWMAPLEQKTGASSRHHPLFSSLLMPSAEAPALHQHFAQQGILLRLIHVSRQQSLVRIGRLDPTDSASVDRFRQTLEGY